MSAARYSSHEAPFSMHTAPAEPLGRRSLVAEAALLSPWGGSVSRSG